ncbi:hypothetical protein [Burkholderia gladioli]|uniref:hypothetical protein n=1 Tax=Burkholderia gladioli TaxID=28095 RepID=UPI00163E3A8B|nr:hypothetical protein [Burkholderia gladioli]
MRIGSVVHRLCRETFYGGDVAFNTPVEGRNHTAAGHGNLVPHYINRELQRVSRARVLRDIHAHDVVHC